MTEADMAATVDLWVASWRATYPEIDFDARRAWFIQHLAAWRADSGEIWLAMESGLDRPAGLLCLKPGTGHLDQLCVDPEHQGRGTADILMAHARLRSPSGLHLDVNADNDRAIRFYRRHGFQQSGEGVNPRSGRATLLMRWQP